jgi:hypothetical protein
MVQYKMYPKHLTDFLTYVRPIQCKSKMNSSFEKIRTIKRFVIFEKTIP